MSDGYAWRVTPVAGRTVQGECSHLDQAQGLPATTARGCEDCLREGGTWVHLRQCLACGHVGCCDSSPKKHAHAHARSGHDLARSIEPGEDWAWCYPDELFLQPCCYGAAR
ncbi:UBP-type zinc finger domain-containing protein [Streptacidiphilus sp. N1-12]|uniref:UBP-type zinc finger domain-containing protein n=2 Tax=Streptacidiphilus alkalitolerans TaxID=3342712 RepID=A0ABV6XE40_9ACTN